MWGKSPSIWRSKIFILADSIVCDVSMQQYVDQKIVCTSFSQTYLDAIFPELDVEQLALAQDFGFGRAIY